MFEYLQGLAGKTVKISNDRTVNIGEVEPDRIKVDVRDSDSLPVKGYCFTTQYVIETPKDLSDSAVRQTRADAEQLVHELKDYY